MALKNTPIKMTSIISQIPEPIHPGPALGQLDQSLQLGPRAWQGPAIYELDALQTPIQLGPATSKPSIYLTSRQAFQILFKIYIRALEPKASKILFFGGDM